MLFSEIKTFIVGGDKIARPKNSNYCTDGYYVPCRELPEGSLCRGCSDWIDFKNESQTHHYAVDESLTPGEYEASLFDKPKYQYFDLVWRDLTDKQQPFIINEDKGIVAGANGISEFLLRKFLPLKQQYKTEPESPKFGESGIQCQSEQQDIEMGFVRAEALKEICKVYGDDFINENIQVASVLIEMYIKGYQLSKTGLPEPPKTL